jgi:Rps23 Pro-64 3,4-dihydroxylase Tpa1-like proline 4-hydroxylase
MANRIDVLCNALMLDSHALSESERLLLTKVLQYAKGDDRFPSEIDGLVAERIAGAVGIVIAEKLLNPRSNSIGMNAPAGSAPSPAGLAPSPAGLAPSPAGLAPSPAGLAPSPAGLAPSPAGLSAPSKLVSDMMLGMNGSAHVPCVVLEEFLVQEELAELLEFTLAHEAEFSTSRVLSDESGADMVSFEQRRSRVLSNLGKHRDVIVGHIQVYLPRILQALQLPSFTVSSVEAQITASNDGDFFKSHTDDGHISIGTRQLTFVYFFYRESRAFTGGELRIYNAGSDLSNSSSCQTLVPEQNQMVIFPSSLVHEVLPVHCPSQAFADSRFTLNGWLHR